MRFWFSFVVLVVGTLASLANALPSWITTSPYGPYVLSFLWQPLSGTPPSSGNVSLSATYFSPGGQLMLFGGTNDGVSAVSDTNFYSYDPVANVWSSTPSPVSSRFAPGYCSTNDGSLFFIYGGAESATSRLDDLWMFNGNGGTWTQLSGDNQTNTLPVYSGSQILPGARRGASLLCVDDNTVLLFGGSTASDNTANDLWLFNITVMSWTWLGGADSPSDGDYGQIGMGTATTIPPSREYATAWYWSSNMGLYVFGGAADTTSSSLLGDFWHFDLLSGIWTWIGCTKGPVTSNSPTTSCPLPRTLSTLLVSNATTTVEIWGGQAFASDGKIRQINDLWSWNQASRDSTGEVFDGSWTVINYNGSLSQAWLPNYFPVPESFLSAAIVGAGGWEDQNGLLYILAADTNVYQLGPTNDSVKYMATFVMVVIVTMFGVASVALVLPRLCLEDEQDKKLRILATYSFEVLPSLLNVATDVIFVFSVPFVTNSLRNAQIAFIYVPLVVPFALSVISIVRFILGLSINIPSPINLFNRRSNLLFIAIDQFAWVIQFVVIIIVLISFCATLSSMFVGVIMLAWLGRVIFFTPFHRPTFGYTLVPKSDLRLDEVFSMASVRIILVVELLLQAFPQLVIQLHTVITMAPSGSGVAIAVLSLLTTSYIIALNIFVVFDHFVKR